MATGSWAQTHQVTLPDRESADRVADALAERGHALVAVREVDWAQKDPKSGWFGRPPIRPAEQGHWDVSSVATGPLPDDDERWWHAQEDVAVRRIARTHGGHSAGSGGGDTATVLRTFTRVGLVHELDEATVRERRGAAFDGTTPRDASAADTGTSGTGAPDDGTTEDDLSNAPGEPVRLDLAPGLDWTTLDHAYGSASDVPDVLAGLAANDERWSEHLDTLVGSVNHQGSTYSSTAPAMGAIAGLAAARALSPRRRLDLFHKLFLAGVCADLATARGSRPGPHDEPTRRAVAEATPDLVGLWPTVSRPERRLLLLLAALAGSTSAPAGAEELTDDASRLALAMVRDEDAAATLLVRLSRSNEQLLELVSDDAPLRARLVAALEVLLWVG
ncbi:hypothetical protein LL946_13820 [Knoellia locipacati]|uniref:hypothetical protein n=1 Tax=Knoellia locipacati TaxID=882824 RepID=UPI00384C8DC7